MTEHTPGPWYVNERNSKIEILPIAPARGFHGQYIEIACIPFPRTGAKRGQSIRYLAAPVHHTNARLIAAAPDLLEALKAAEEWLDGWASAEPYICVIRAAIAKAEGK